MIHDNKIHKLALAGFVWLLVAVAWGTVVTMLFSRAPQQDKVANLPVSPEGLRVWAPGDGEETGSTGNAMAHLDGKSP